MSLKIAFRVDASHQIGTGHVMRCLTLADELQSHDANCDFYCRAHEGNLIDLITKRGHAASSLPVPTEPIPQSSLKLAHSSWLGSDQHTDAEQTRDLIDQEGVDWLVVDHYALDHRWEETMQHYSKRIMVIDDLADRRHDCDLLLD